MFGESFVFWNEGMPGNIGLTIVRYIYQQAFQRNDMGFGSAIGIVLLAIVLTINLIQLRFFGAFKKEE
jgi:arabinosaccharide transport system permease protein